MLEETRRLLLREAVHHFPQNERDVGEALVGLANVLQAQVVEKDLLHDERRHRLGQLAAQLRGVAVQAAFESKL